MRHLRRLAHCLAAGAVAGAALCPLQLVLWPELQLPAGKLVLAFFAWASWGSLWLGLGSFLVVEVAGLFADELSARPGISIGLWRWLVAAQGFLVGGVAFFNRDLTRELLVKPRRSALSLAGTVAGLYAIALLVAALRRHRARHPLINATIGGVALVAGMWLAWGVAPPLPASEATGPSPRFSSQRRLLFVSWEGADLSWLVPAIERGDMPFLRSQRDSGAWGQVRTVRPFSRAAALPTLATGCLPSVNGVPGRRVYRLPWLSPDAVSLLLEGPWPTPHQLPWRQWQRAAAPPPRRAQLWEMLEHSGQTVGLVGWPGLVEATWTVHPPLAADAIPFASLDPSLRSALQPALKAHPEIAARTRTAFSIAVQLGADASLHTAASPVDTLIFDTDLPTRLRPLWTLGESEPTHTEVFAQAARVLDEQLAELWALVGGDDTLLVVVSPYGMGPPSPWRRLEHLFGGAEKWRVSPTDSPDGFVLFAGRGVREGARLRGCRLADVTATALYLLGLPVARDMSGRVLLDAVTEEQATDVPLRLVPSYPSPPRGR
jgi:hypothetical protein